MPLPPDALGDPQEESPDDDPPEDDSSLPQPHKRTPTANAATSQLFARTRAPQDE
ncbi:MAG: hypothetical protein KF696_10050 [Planctomycetes bacterium]|nr:hypothetical protein [Planctomycetota bacterium]MCW8136199.1 hypothetical protein [Planctomycetota bacterium]